MSKLFGGSKSKSRSQSQQQSTSYNRAFDSINRGFGNNAAASFNAGTYAINEELKGGFDAYKENNNFDFMRALGLERTSTPYAGSGVFNSGAAMKALARYDADYKDQFYNNYLDRLFQQSQLGLGGGSLLTGAGGYSQSSGSSSSRGSSKSSPGLGGFLGPAFATMSDRRLKENIVQIGELENGLPLYSYTYIWSDKPETGVMADDVAKIQPEALGPVTNDGYQTVYYDLIDWE